MSPKDLVGVEVISPWFDAPIGKYYDVGSKYTKLRGEVNDDLEKIVKTVQEHQAPYKEAKIVRKEAPTAQIVHQRKQAQEALNKNKNKQDSPF